MLNEELNIDADDEMDLEFEGETASEESSNKKSESQSETSGMSVDGWKEATTGDKKPKAYTFTTNAGSNLTLPNAEPMDYFTLFFNDELVNNTVIETMNNTVIETNSYARDKIAKFQLCQGSIWRRRSDVSVPKMKALLGLIINMGLIPLPDIKDYWSSEWTTQIKFIGNVMSRDCFLQIF
jgi:hypothetical protein